MYASNYFFQDEFSQFENFICTVGKRKIIKKNSILQDVNITPHHSYYVKKGLIKLSVSNEEGAEKTLMFFGKGSIYPLIVSDKATAMENYLEFTAVTDLEVIRFPSLRIKELLAKNQEFVHVCIDHYAKYTNLLLCNSLLNLYNDSTKNTCTFLYLYKRNLSESGEDIISLTQEQIGKILGLSRVQVSRVLSMLRNDNIIETNRNRIKILDYDKLRSLCSDVVE